MMSTAQAKPKKAQFKLTGFHVAACMVAFFGVIIAVNMFMAILASRSWTGLIVKNSYVASQKFNQQLSNAEAQKATGWSTDISYQDAKLAMNFVNKDGEPLAASNVQVELGRPAFEQQDRTVVANTVNGTQYTLDLPLEPGVWSLRVNATIEGKSYRRDSRILVDANQNGSVR